MSMEGTKVLITGGARGIGAIAAADLAERGCTVALCDRLEKELGETASRIGAEQGFPVRPFVCDISDPDRVRETVSEIIDWAGGLDVLVNNAGVIGPPDPLENVAMEDWRKPMDVNLFGTVHCTRAVLPQMKRQRHGKIINYAGAGVGWKVMDRLHTSYVTSKFAVYGFTEALAKDLVDDNIQVNIISPGKVETPLWNGVSPERREELRRSGQDLSGASVVRLIAFLASARSGRLTGKILSADWDDVEELARDLDNINDSCRHTIRKIDERNYFAR